MHDDDVNPDTFFAMTIAFNRRTFLLGSAAAATLAACGSSGPSPDRLAVRFPDGFRAPSVAVTGHGAQRFPFVIVADDGLPLATNNPESIDIEIIYQGETLETQTVPASGVGQFIPYYALSFTPPAAGSYIARTEFSDFDVEFAVVERSDTPLWQVGENLPGFDTPTFDDARGVDPICTRSGEPCDFHEMTLAEALTNGRPTALLISTPSFCQTDVCGPSLENLIAASTGRDDINIIHQEVYADFGRDTDTGIIPELAPLLLDWDLAFEPSLFVMDADATIVGARHFAFDSAETEELVGLI